MKAYDSFISTKLRRAASVGLDSAKWMRTEHLFDFQEAITGWALRKGRAAIFADTGLGKTRMQLTWADAINRATGNAVIILAPLAVAEQTVSEGRVMGIDITHARDGADCKTGINITNYDRLHRFDPSLFNAVVLDESSIIKHHDAKTLGVLMDAFRDARFKLCATATPAPNDWTELGTHAEFLGICSRSEMLSEFFVHDGGETQVWRLKGHAKSEFWKWVSSWGAMIRSPSDLGMDSTRYDLPALNVRQIVVESDAKPQDGELFTTQAQTLSERRAARRASLRQRVSACAEMANTSDEPWVIWCDLNAEGDALRAAIPDAVEIRGADTIEHKERSLAAFPAGEIRVLVTKPKIAGFGLNWQHCRNVAFVGVTDSWEAYYQAVRRCWRFGQKREVNVSLFVSEQEGAVRANLERKEIAAKAMLDSLSQETRKAVQTEILGQALVTNTYVPKTKTMIPDWLRSVA